MAPPTYGTRDGLFRLGLPPQVLKPIARQVEEIDVDADTLVIRGHGFVGGDKCRISSQAANGQPAGTSNGVPYLLSIVSEDVFQLLPVGGGPPVDITSTGVRPVVIEVDTRPAIEYALYSNSRVIDQECTAHETPFQKDADGNYPIVVVRACEAMAAYDLMVTRGTNHPQYAQGLAGIKERRDVERAQLEKLFMGKPVKGAIDQTPTSADNGARAASLSGGVNEFTECPL